MVLYYEAYSVIIFQIKRKKATVEYPLYIEAYGSLQKARRLKQL
jgi:hypothetical protein